MLASLSILCGCVFYVLWRCLRPYVVRSTLHNLPGPKSSSFLSGNMKSLFDTDNGVQWQFDMVQKFGRAFKIYGYFGHEQVYVTDPLALHHIVLKDQDVYEETSMFIAGNRLILGPGLLGTLGKQHRKQRKLLNPVFSTTHMRGLVPMFYSGAYEFRETLLNLIGHNGFQEIDMRPLIAKISMEYIGRGGFGYSFNSFEDESTNEYRRAIRDIPKVYFSLSFFRQLMPWAVKIGSPSFRRKLVDLLSFGIIKRSRDMIDTLHLLSLKVYEKKKAEFLSGLEEKDIMSVLLKANASSHEDDRLEESEVFGQMNTLIFAGAETTSSAIAHLLYLLAGNTAVQAKLREEVLVARDNNGGEDLEHDELVALPYLDAVIRETLRLYPPISSLPRTSRKDIVLPLSTPITASDGTQISAIPLKNNTNVVIGIAAANRDPAIWGPDAEDWRPERWLGKDLSEVGKEKLPGVYSGMMTFLGGSRGCIGFKFSQLEIKVVLSMLLETFELSLPDGKEIIWRSGPTHIPVTSDDKEGPPKLPLKVVAIKKDQEGCTHA